MATAPDLPPPGPQSAEDRLKISQRFIIHGREELEKGNRLQAGGKAWGAAVHLLKVIADERGWRQESNSHMQDIGSLIAEEFNSVEVARALGEAYHIGHINFYENYRNPETLARMLDDLEEVLPNLVYFTQAPPRPVTITTNSHLRRVRSLTGLGDLEVGSTSPVGFSLKHSA